jgi:hypothetical protein
VADCHCTPATKVNPHSITEMREMFIGHLPKPGKRECNLSSSGDVSSLRWYSNFGKASMEISKIGIYIVGVTIFW